MLKAIAFILGLAACGAATSLAAAPSTNRGPLHTEGNQIVDRDGNPVRIAGVVWMGMESKDLAPVGLYAQRWKSLLGRAKASGFNTIRLAFSVEGLNTAKLVFSGTARQAAAGFPANVNVAAALSLAGIGPDRTMIDIWADPAVSRNCHSIEVDSDSARFTLSIENIPSENPKTGKNVALSVIAALRKMHSPLAVGT